MVVTMRALAFTRWVALIAVLGFAISVLAQTPTRSPSDTVREFYKAMHEKRFRDAFAMSIYKPAIEGLKPEQLEELRPDFERVAGIVPEKIEISGEQIRGYEDSVFVKVTDEADPTQLDTNTTPLLLVDGNWIIGDKESQALVNKAGNTFFFEARIMAHHDEVKTMLQRISVAELLYSQQHSGLFGDLTALTGAGLVPKDA